MLLLKSFFRQKSFKIYVVVFSVLLTALIIILSFISYYNNYEVKIYQENSYFLVTRNKNIYNELLNNKSIIALEKIVLLNYDKNYELIKLLGYNDNFVIRSYENLKDDEVILNIPALLLNNDNNIKKLENNTIVLNFQDDLTKFNVTKITESNFFEIIIADSVLAKLIEQNNTYSYIFDLNDYSNLTDIQKNLTKIEEVKDLKLIQSFQSDSAYETLEQLESIITILELSVKVFTFIIIFLFVLITIGIINQELEKMCLERSLGYSKYQIKKILILKILIMSLLVYFIAILSYFVVCFLIEKVLKIELFLHNYLLIIYFYGVLLLLSLIFCILLKIKNY